MKDLELNQLLGDDINAARVSFFGDIGSVFVGLYPVL